MALLLINLTGCGDANMDSAGLPDSKTVISKAARQLANANSFELLTYREEIYTAGDKRIETKTNADAKTILEPYTQWAKTDMTTARAGGEKSRTVMETYRIVKGEGMEFYVRSTQMRGTSVEDLPPITDWEAYPAVTKEQADLLLQWFDRSMSAELYLLSLNIDSFQLTDSSGAEDSGLLKYAGSIDPATVREAYRKYLRESYIEMHFVADKEYSTDEDLRKEIAGGTPELQVGLTKLAFSDKPVPITLWVDQESFVLKKVTIDERAVLQALLDKTFQDQDLGVTDCLAERSTLTYEFKDVDQIKKIPRPE